MLGDNGSQPPRVGCTSDAPSGSASDLTGRLRALRVGNGAFSPGVNAGDVYQRTYTWQADQVKQIDTCLLGAATPRTETYSYDGALRLTAAARPEGNAAATGGAFTSRTYGYDGRGRRVSLREDGMEKGKAEAQCRGEGGSNRCLHDLSPLAASLRQTANRAF